MDSQSFPVKEGLAEKRALRYNVLVCAGRQKKKHAQRLQRAEG